MFSNYEFDTRKLVSTLKITIDKPIEPFFLNAPPESRFKQFVFHKNCINS